eukprot:sb/3465372/
MALFSEGGVTFPDFLFFLYFLFILLLAVTLNSLVLHHNYNKRPSLPRTLFMIVATTDILVCVIFSVGSAYSIWSPKMSADIIECSQFDVCQAEVYDNYYYMCAIHEGSNITPAMGVFTVIAFGVQLAPVIVTGVFTTVRYISIRFPLRTVNKRMVLAFLGSVLPFAFVVFTVCLADTATYEKSYVVSLNMAMPRLIKGDDVITDMDIMTDNETSSVIPGPPRDCDCDCKMLEAEPAGDVTVDYIETLRAHVIAISPTLVIQLVGLVATGFTILHLLKMHYRPEVTGSNQPRSHIKGTVKLLIMNFGSLLSFTLFINAILRGNDIMNASNGKHEDFKVSIIFQFFTFQILPSLTSTLNPTLYIAFTSNTVLPDRLTRWCKKKNGRTANQTTSNIKETTVY